MKLSTNLPTELLMRVNRACDSGRKNSSKSYDSKLVIEYLKSNKEEAKDRISKHLSKAGINIK